MFYKIRYFCPSKVVHACNIFKNHFNILKILKSAVIWKIVNISLALSFPCINLLAVTDTLSIY